MVNSQDTDPVAWMWKDGTVTSDPDRADGTWTPLYTAPQPRKRLTDDELWNIYDDFHTDTPSYDRPPYQPELYRAIEAAVWGESA